MLKPMETPVQVSIIDDSSADAQYLNRLLSNLSGWDIEVSIFDSPDEAYENLKDNPPDILIVDYLLGLGRENGVEVMQRFKSSDVHPALVLLTGHGGEKVATDAMRAGAMDYLIKDTLTPDTLARSLRYVIERKEAEEQLLLAKQKAEIADRAKTNFLASMSHELRTPLNSILGFSETIQHQVFGPLEHEKYSEYIDNIHESAQHLLDLINDILDVSRIEERKLILHEESLDIAAMADTCCRLIKPNAKEGNVRLNKQFPNDLPPMFADERAIKQILLNLLSNAVKFTSTNGSVTIGAKVAETGEFVITVSDTGLGMDEKSIETAMLPFGQVDSSITRKFKGTGLGLPLSKGLVEAHGGTLVIESEVDVGTKVLVTFPPERTLRQ